MATDTESKIVIKGDTEDAVKGLRRVNDALNQVSTQSKTTQSVLQSFMGGIGGLTAAVAGGTGLAYAAKKAGSAILDFGKSTIQAADNLQALESRARLIY